MSTATSVYREEAIPRILSHLLSSNMKSLEHKPMFSRILSRCFRHMIMIMIMLHCKDSLWMSF